MIPPRIVVGIERSDRTDDALALARTLATPASARLVLAGACEFPSIALAGANPAGLFAEESVAEGRALVARRAAELRAAGLDVEEVVSAFGSPASVLQSAAEEHEADLIVIGSTHTTPRGRLDIGADPVVARTAHQRGRGEAGHVQDRQHLQRGVVPGRQPGGRAERGPRLGRAVEGHADAPRRGDRAGRMATRGDGDGAQGAGQQPLARAPRQHATARRRVRRADDDEVRLVLLGGRLEHRRR